MDDSGFILTVWAVAVVLAMLLDQLWLALLLIIGPIIYLEYKG